MEFLKRLFTLGKDEVYEKAMSFYNNHMYKESIELFEEILNRKPLSSSLYHNLARVYCGQAHRNMGIMLFAIGNFSAALKEFQAALQLNPEHIEACHFMGICQNNVGDFESAVKTFNSILEVDQSHLSTKLKLGIALHNLKMWDKAESIYSNILLKKPHFADVHFHLGLALLGQGKHAEAVKSFQEAVKINPNYVEARKKLGITQAYLGNLDKALSSLKAIVEKFPDYADIYYFLGIVHAERNEVEEAIESFRHSLQINPSYKDSKIKLGILYCRMEKFSGGLRELKEASGLDPDNQNLEMAIDVIQKMINTSLYSSEKLSEVLGQIFGGDKLFTQTIQEFNRHIQINPDFSDILPIIKDFSEEDTPLCETLIPFIKDYILQHSEYADLHNTLGRLYLRLHRTEEAETSFMDAVRLNPDFLNARINLFKVLKDLGKFQEALEQGKYIIAKAPPYPDVYCTMGEVCYCLSMYNEVLDNARKALDLNSRYVQAHFLIAQVYEKQGNNHEAIKELEQCLSLNISKELYIKAKESINKLKST